MRTASAMGDIYESPYEDFARGSESKGVTEGGCQAPRGAPGYQLPGRIRQVGEDPKGLG